MRPSALIYMYRCRLRAHAVQELLAGIGIAIAVALVFAAVLSESSIAGSAERVVSTVVGPAQLQLRSRGDEGFAESEIERVQRLAGVRRAAPLLEESATIARPDGRSVQVELAGTDLRLATLDGLAETLPIGSLSTHGAGVSEAAALTLGLSPAGAGRSSSGGSRSPTGSRQKVTLKLRGRSYPLSITAVLGREAAGALADAYVAVMPLRRLQRLAGLPGAVSRIFVQAEPNRRIQVERELRKLAGGQMEVAPADREVALLAQALGPSRLASGLFAAIGALLGLLLAFNAMLLTVAERRRAITDLRVAGARRGSVVEMVVFQALCLGVPASLAGIAAGYLLSTGAFHQSTGYLAEAFTLSGTTLLHPATAALAFAGGLVATFAASAVPLLDLRRGRSRDHIFGQVGIPGNAFGGGIQGRLAAAALCLAAVATGLWIALPVAAIPATALLALATVMTVPLAFGAVLGAAAALGDRLQRVSILPLALASLRATTVRSLALAATGAVALFGSVALGGSRQDLIKGIGTFAHSYVADAQIWVGSPGDNQAVSSFRSDGAEALITRLPGVRSVRRFQGGFVEVGGRRVWAIARPAGAQRHVLASQIQRGDAAVAARRLAEGGWVAVSTQIAAERHLALGGRLTLPTPSGPRVFRLAATTTNLAWPPGVIFIGTRDWRKDWRTTAPTALGVQISSGARASVVRSRIAAALGASSGLEAVTAGTRAKRIEALASEGLGQLREVSTMLLIAAIVAMVAALLSAMWQRRPSLAGLRLYGAGKLSLQAILMIEAFLILGAGCLTGAVAGLYGQVVIDAFLREVTGFPLANPTADVRPLVLFALVLAAAMAVATLPSWLASRVRPMVAVAREQ